MADDPLMTLERELVAAARRQTAALGGRHWRTAFGGVLTVAAALLAAVVAVGAALLLGGHGGRGGTRPGAGPTRTDSGTYTAVPLTIESSVYALVNQHPGNGTRPLQPTSRQVDGVARQLGFARYNALTFTDDTLTVPGGVKITLWEFAVRPAGRPERDVIAAVMNNYVISKRTATQMADRGLTVIYDSASPIIRIAVVVPNQVRAVAIASARVVPSRAVVHDNLASFRITGLGGISTSIASRMTWYGRGGAVLRHVANH
jgi:hypothetical protein